MSVLGDARAALTAQIAAQVPDVQVLAIPPAGNQDLQEAIWVDAATCEFEWRSIGAGPSFASRNRTENLIFELRVQTYREAPSHLDASEEAISRAEELLREIEFAIQQTGGVGNAEFSLGGIVTSCLVRRWSVTPRAADKGWIVDGRVTVEATNVV